MDVLGRAAAAADELAQGLLEHRTGLLGPVLGVVEDGRLDVLPGMSHVAAKYLDQVGEPVGDARPLVARVAGRTDGFVSTLLKQRHLQMIGATRKIALGGWFGQVAMAAGVTNNRESESTNRLLILQINEWLRILLTPADIPNGVKDLSTYTRDPSRLRLLWMTQ